MSDATVELLVQVVQNLPKFCSQKNFSVVWMLKVPISLPFRYTPAMWEPVSIYEPELF